MSTVLANTITAVGGGGSTVKVNNDSTYISDGGAVTDSNLVQGLAKYFGVWDSKSDNVLRDSFNVSGVTDNATGDFTVAFTNAMGNAFYSALGNVSGENNVYGVCSSQDTHATTTCGYQARDTSGNTIDVDKNSLAGIGDLA